MREIAAAAKMDPAMIPRLFGSKAALFAHVARDAFGLEPAFDGPVEGLAERAARHLVQPIVATPPDAFDEFAFLLRSVGSPVAAPILSAALHASFIGPLAARMNGPAAEARAALATASVLGFAILRVGLGSPALDHADRELLVARLGAVIQSCLAP